MSRILSALYLSLVAAVLTTLSVTWAAQRQQRSMPAVLVDSVDAESPAAILLRAGDRLRTYDHRQLSSPAALQAAIENTVGKPAIELQFDRGGQSHTVTVPSGQLGIAARFELPAFLSKIHDAGKAALQRQLVAEAASNWTLAAKAAQMSGQKEAAAWLRWLAASALEGSHPEQACAAHGAAWALVGAPADPAGRAVVLATRGRCSTAVNDFRSAEEWFVRALETNLAEGNDVWVADNLAELGMLARARGNLEAAEGYHNRARAARQRLAPDSLRVADSIDSLGLVAFDRGRLTEAEDLCTRGLAIRERLAPDSMAVAASHNNLGNVAWSRGDLKAATTHHRRALAIREARAPNSLEVAASLNNLGLVAWNSGNLAAADDLHHRALAIRERLAPDSLSAATSLNNLGEVARGRGDLARAHEFHSRSLAIKERLAPGSVAVAKSLSNLGELARERGDFEAAENYHRSAFAIRERSAPKSLELAISLSSLGEVARSRGELSQAGEYHTRALALRKDLAPDSLDVAESASHLGDVALNSGDFTRASDYYWRGLRIRERLAPDSLEVAASFGGLGDAAKGRTQLASARDYYTQALAIQERLAPASLEVATSLVALGEVALRERRVRDALALFKRSVDIVEAQRGQITSTDGRALLLAVHSTPHAGLLRTYLALDEVPGAFATVERARARSLADLLAERRLDFRADAPASVLKQQEELEGRRFSTYSALTEASAELIAVRRELNQLDASTKSSRFAVLEAARQKHEKRLRELRDDLTRWTVEQRDLESRIRQSSPRFAALQYPQPFDLQRAQAALDAGTLLLTYVVDDDASYLFAVTRTEVRLFPLAVGRTMLTERVRSFRAMVTREKLGDPAESGYRLYALLVSPAQALVDSATRVLVCPDGPLQALPFAALVSRTAPLRYFIDQRPIHTISSMTVYAEARQDPAAVRTARGGNHKVSVLAFGDPLYSKAQVGQSKSVQPIPVGAQGASRARLDALAPLPRTREEVETIVRLFGASARARLGTEATETAAKREAQDARILHFASHALIDEAMGLSSGLVLSQPTALGRAPTPEDDGILQAWEIIEGVRVNAQLVVLSACQTGLGEHIRGEGLMGLTRAFLYAGARTVAVSLWDISDAGTADFMTTFYQRVRDGSSKDVALQQAMIAARRDPARKHPFFWAPFILVGDWR